MTLYFTLGLITTDGQLSRYSNWIWGG